MKQERSSKERSGGNIKRYMHRWEEGESTGRSRSTQCVQCRFQAGTVTVSAQNPQTPSKTRTFRHYGFADSAGMRWGGVMSKVSSPSLLIQKCHLILY